MKHGRTVHSLAKVLALFNVKLVFVAPEQLSTPPGIVAELEARGVDVAQHTHLTPDLVAASDVLYVTRIQAERFETREAFEAVKGVFVVNAATLADAKDRMVVMHPLPRVDEISTDVDSDPKGRAAYFRQMENGLYARMALLALLSGKALP